MISIGSVINERWSEVNRIQHRVRQGEGPQTRISVTPA